MSGSIVNEHEAVTYLFTYLLTKSTLEFSALYHVPKKIQVVRR